MRIRLLSAIAKQLIASSSSSSLHAPGHGRRSLSYFSRWGANEASKDPARQAEMLRSLNAQGQCEAVINHFEAGHVAFTADTLGEYVRALARLDRLDNNRFMGLVQKGAEQGFNLGVPATPAWGAAARGSTALSAALTSAMGSAAADGPLGTNKNPIVMTFAEPTFASQFWRTARALGSVLLAMACVAAFLDEKGLAKGFLGNQELKPQLSSNAKFADVMGVDEAKNELMEVVEYLRDPKKFTNLGGKLPKGVLLVGPPGTGKTLLARAIAGEAGVPFFYCSGSEFEEVFVGVGARRVRDLFAAAKKHSPCIIFIDEVDAIGGKRSPKDQQFMRMTLNQLLVEMDGFKATEGVIVVAATNFPEVLDKALVRPGRFDRHVVVPNPDVEGRRQILERHCKDIPRSSDVDLKVIARATPGFSGADLANLVNVAALQAAKSGRKAVDMISLEFARDRIIMGAERKSAVISEKSRRLTAYHEGGHALVAFHTPGADPVHKATIVPRGLALGMVSQLPDEDVTTLSRRQMLARLDVCMGGRVAEELIFGDEDVTTGASSDLKQATDLARAMVTKYGMSSRLGQVSFEYEDEGRSISSETRMLIEGEVKELVQGAYARAQAILKGYENELHALAKSLLENETLTGEQIKELLAAENSRPVKLDGKLPVITSSVTTFAVSKAATTAATVAASSPVVGAAAAAAAVVQEAGRSTTAVSP